ncbi:sigma factor binding protein 2, chloroplastic-like [Argentina anserina]|uniref:sigma factor binding protein 2, chloroplastic-like n=1 Tax=Argentina anserina TaxID=57926 RepID=UPI0021762E57|nr:sigma factor binding protein 2, chloroplastic-like [Potentilla anserina]
MDMLGVNNRSPKQSKRSRSSKGVKVVYISSPMKVQTSASKFRDLVQELTGRDSDAERFMETNGGDGHHNQNVADFSYEKQLKAADCDHHVFPHRQIPFSNSIYEFPYFSDSLFDSFTGHFELDALRSFDQF